LWFQFSVKATLNRLKPDLFLSLDGNICLKAKCRQLAVIHDINFFHNPNDLPFWAKKYYNYFFPKFAKKSTRIATVSEYSKEDISKYYNVSKDKIDVVYNGINDFLHPIGDEQKLSVKNKFTKGKNYFLFVGSLHARKNPVRLIQAFELFKNESNSDIKLVFAGEHMWGDDEIKSVLKTNKYSEDVIFTGRLGDLELNNIIGSAFALTYVPYFEGFGIPLVEAMQCEVPIICSNVTSIPEVVGNAALQVNPFDINEIKNAMILLFNDEQLRTDLVAEGKIRKQYFSWDKSAELLWKSIEKCF
jgi:glycosyltransferase involved in cell wall biosynthesis